MSNKSSEIACSRTHMINAHRVNDKECDVRNVSKESSNANVHLLGSDWPNLTLVLESKKSNVQPRLATATDVRRRTLDDASIAAPVGAAAASSSSSSLDNSLPASILDPQTAKIMQLNGIEEANWTPFIAPTSSRRVAVHSMADA